MTDVMNARTCMMTDIWNTSLGQYDILEDMLDGYFCKSVAPVIHENGEEGASTGLQVIRLLK